MMDTHQMEQAAELPGEEEGEHWISVSDLMAGLMMVFLFVSIALMRDAVVEKKKIEEIAVSYQKNQEALYKALMKEFDSDLKKWQATIDKSSLSFEFHSPDVLFDTGQIGLKPQFENILADFFPRYMNVLWQFKSSIREVRIEGHTSSLWNEQTTHEEAYFKNMILSQGRTRTVLKYAYHIDAVKNKRDWIKKKIAAVGLSSSHAKIVDGKEDYQASRRVTFRIITNAEKQIRKILAN